MSEVGDKKLEIDQAMEALKKALREFAEDPHISELEKERYLGRDYFFRQMAIPSRTVDGLGDE